MRLPSRGEPNTGVPFSEEDLEGGGLLTKGRVWRVCQDSVSSRKIGSFEWACLSVCMYSYLH